MADPAPGALVISLDFELFWGKVDNYTEAYRPNLVGVRKAIPGMLEIFQRYGVHATWATVGFLMFDGRSDLKKSLPDRKPRYRNARLDSYALVDGLGDSEEEDPLHFAPSLVRKILDCPGQEIGSHTFSHLNCLEEEVTPDDFEADIQAWNHIGARFGVTPRSFVFPRNQFNAAAVEALSRYGFSCYRGNEKSRLFRAASRGDQRLWIRALRLGDSYFNLTGSHTHSLARPDRGAVDVPASRFLRPITGRGALDRLRLRRITNAMDVAAREGTIFHLWWHPHNFGVRTAENIEYLGSILDRFRHLQDRHGMRSLSMAEAAAAAGGPA